jgi:hypothetical protein
MATAPPPLKIAGERDFRLDDPKPEIDQSRDSEDTLVENYTSSARNRFVPGAVHPRFGGMIIDRVKTTVIAEGHLYRHAVSSFGDIDGKRPTKIVSRGQKRTLNEGWDEIPIQYLSWLAGWKACTAEADDNKITCQAHGYAAGQRVKFSDLTGGTGITPMSDTALGTTYFVIDPTPHTFKISLTAGGAAVDITLDMTAGYVQAAEFCLGAAHPEHANMFLIDLDLTDRNTDWKSASVVYRGMIKAKPFKRIITCAGQTISAENLTVDFDDGFINKPNGQASLPKIVCTDTYLTTSALDTGNIPLSEGEGATPPDPPAVRSIVITAADDKLRYIWPNGWTRPAEEHLDSIPLVVVHLKKRTSEYVHAVVFA